MKQNYFFPSPYSSIKEWGIEKASSVDTTARQHTRMQWVFFLETDTGCIRKRALNGTDLHRYF